MLKLSRAVTYDYTEDGQLNIKLVGWDGTPRLSQFPLRIRARLDVNTTLFMTAPEADKLFVARFIGKEVEEAVLDDLRCTRATIRLAREGNLKDPLLPAALLTWGADAREHASPHDDWLPDFLAQLTTMPPTEIEDHHRAMVLIDEMDGPEGVAAYAEDRGIDFGSCRICGPSPASNGFCLQCLGYAAVMDREDMELTR